MTLRTLLLAAFLSCGLGRVPHAQAVVNVDPTGAGGAFTDLQAAVDAAADGDLLLLASGTYGDVTIDGRSLALAARPGASPSIEGRVIVRNVGATQSVELSGLLVEASLAQPVVSIRSCAGPILIQECIFRSSSESYTAFAIVGVLQVFNSQSVTLVSTQVVPGTGTNALPVGVSPGVRSSDSTIRLYACAAVGGTGLATGSSDPTRRGGPALLLRGGTAEIIGGALIGGRGGPSYEDFDLFGGPFCVTDGTGGPALRLEGAATVPEALVVDAILVPGPGGVPGDGCAGGPAGTVTTEVLAGSVSTSTAVTKSLEVTPVVASGGTKRLTLSGEPFDLVWIALSPTQSPVPAPPDLFGAVYPGSPLFVFKLGALDAGGTKVLDFVLSPTGLDFVPIFEQAFFFNATEGFTISNPRLVALIDSLSP